MLLFLYENNNYTSYIMNSINYKLWIFKKYYHVINVVFIAHLPFFIRYPLQLWFSLLLPLLFLGVIFIYKGGSVRFGLPLFNFSLLSSSKTSSPLDNAQKRQTIELIREVFNIYLSLYHIFIYLYFNVAMF